MRSLALLLSFAALAAAAPAPRPHPRIEVDAPLLQQLRTLRDANDPLWTRFYRSANGNSNDALLSGMLAYLVTGEKPFYDRAWQTVRYKIYRNKTDRSAGLMPIIELYKDAHDAAYMGGVFLGAVAHFYDWGYTQLSPDERRDVVAWLNDAAAFAHLKNADARLYMRNDGASVTQGLAAAAYATLGENPQGDQLLVWFRERWDQTLKGLDIIGKGGATGEGNAYGTAPTASGIITSANIAYYAAGEDLFPNHPFFRQRLLYDAFAAYPDTIGGPEGTVKYPATAPSVEQASIAGDGRRAISWHSRNLRRNGLTLSRRFAGTEEAAIWNWVYRQPAVDQAAEDAESVFDLLYYSPRPRLVKPKRLSFFDPSMGFVYIRSDWDSPDATWISFWAGPHIDTHQHLDQGAFTIFKRRDLAPKTGHYDSGVFSPHHISYYLRTVSSNGLLIGDPSEIFRGYISGMGCDENGVAARAKDAAKWPGCIPNDGGQRTMSPLSLAVANAAAYERNRDVLEVAKVLSFRDDGKAVTVVADITNAYNNARHTTPGNAPKVKRVWRRLVYLRPLDVLLIGDTVESTDAKFEKKWLLHALDRVEIGGKAEKVDEGEAVYRGVDTAKVVVDDADPSDRDQTTFDLRRGYAALLVKTVFPAQFQYRKIGGREPAAAPHSDLYNPGRTAGHYHRHIKDFWIKDYSEGVIPNHKSFNWAPERPTEISYDKYMPVYGPGYGRWRLEVEPASPAKTDFFLNVLRPTLDKGEALPPIRRTESSATYGAEIVKDGVRYRVAFGKDDITRVDVEVSR